MAEKAHLDNTNTQNEEHNGEELQHDKARSKNQYINNINSKNNQKNDHEFVESFENKELVVDNSEHNEHDLEIIGKSEQSFDDVQNKQLSSNNEPTSQNLRYNRSISTDHRSCQQRSPNIQKTNSVPGDSRNNEESSENSQNKDSVSKDLRENRSMSMDSSNNNFSKFEESEERKPECNYYSPIARLLNPSCEGIRERIELLGELLSCKIVDSVPDIYDEMAQIIAATERNEWFQADPDGQRLLELTTAARSNLNVDLHNLDVEIQRQFGLHSVEVTGDGACAFRAILISGMQKPDCYCSELREKAIQQVWDDTPYYSTVLRPGEKVSEEELKSWADSMVDPNTYGDEMANIAVADRCHIQLVIFRAGELLTVVNPRDGYVEHTAFLVNVGTHYKALVPWHELKEARTNSERLCK